MAITDHDTIAALAEARAAAEAFGIEFLNGVEISAAHHGLEVHVLGLGVDPACSTLTDALDGFRQGRIERAEKIMAKLVALGVPIEAQKVFTRAEGGSVGRMHIAAELHAMGLVPTVQAAFDRYIKGGKPAYVRRPAPSCAGAIELIHAAGGLAFVAHPGIGTMPKLLRTLLNLPFDGIEVYHSRHHPDQSAEFLILARDRDLLVTGGSDCHGAAKGHEPEMGKVRLAWEHYERIKSALAR